MLKSIAKSAARHLGFDIRRFDPSNSSAAQLAAALSWHGVNLIFDIGANVGQYGKELRSHVGYKGRIISFEPMKLAHTKLQRVASADPLWEVSDRSAIGAQTGVVRINISNNSVSSSILPMLESHVSAAPQSSYQSYEDVPLIQFDSISQRFFEGGTVAFLKIDTQGYESQVLEGAEKTVDRVVGIQLELSLIPLYEGQLLMPELISKVEKWGFDLWGIFPTFAHPRSGRMLQVDAIFFRKGRSE